MPELILYIQYTRKQVRDIMEPDANYTPGAGSWGIAGVINLGGSFDHLIILSSLSHTVESKQVTYSKRGYLSKVY